MLISIVTFITGCGPVQAPIATTTPPEGYYRVQLDENRKDDFKVVVVDGCQYLYQYSGRGASLLTHKGNCTNHLQHAERP